jgi:hypothetical protein
MHQLASRASSAAANRIDLRCGALTPSLRGRSNPAPEYESGQTKSGDRRPGREAAGESRWTPHLVVVRPTPHGVGLGRQVCKPTGREAAGESRWTLHLVVVRPTPHGVGLGRRPREALGGPELYGSHLILTPAPIAYAIGLPEAAGSVTP